LHGILGIGGTVAMVLGAMLLIDGPPEMRIHLSTALSVTIPFALITMFLVTLVIQARRNKAVMGSDTLVNQIAEARTPLSPSGTVFLQGEYWNAESEAPVEKGGHVRVVSVDGLKLSTRKRSCGDWRNCGRIPLAVGEKCPATRWSST